MTKTVSCRISNELHQKLRDRCNEVGASINDYLAGCIELGLNGTTDVELTLEDKQVIPTDAHGQHGPLEEKHKPRHVIVVE